MKIDVARLVGAVTREVSTREVDGKSADVIVASRTYDTTVEDLWDALTDPERISRWLAPVTGDLRAGGRFQIEGNAAGEITKCEPPSRLAVTWESAGNVSRVEVQLKKSGTAAALLRLEHVAHIPRSFWDEYGPGATGVGWEQALLGLDLLFAKGAAPVSRKEAEAWVTTEPGKKFIREISEAWGRASIADGTDAAAAEAAAQRTAKFYGG